MTALRGGGAAGELIRKLDWASSPLGVVETWPIGLKAALGLLLNSRFPMARPMATVIGNELV